MGPRHVVVLDSNVLVSALGWQGAPHQVYHLCRSGSLTLRTSQPLLLELERVLRYPKFEFTEPEILRFLSDVLALRKYRNIRIVSARALLNRLEG